ncbi:hypothetical protein J8L85_05050 [Maribacter sp. MMG018]|uniref:hypothetical protein n=1 Tax=Maribacter sp. MMG018 TaxID=2822688 RepID=UPI001B36BF2D|nr:hypothetical protein [Maribacter sp. MMG018]MBQ4913793.1 hypothetical protein [Maribacter sp. MMG018]
MKIRKQIILVLAIYGLVSLSGCKDRNENRYADAMLDSQRIMEEELRKEEQVDSIFYGIHFKMTQGQFHEHCNEMHKKGIFNGNSNYEIFIKINEGYKKPVNLVFSPVFKEPFVKKLKVRFSYADVSVFDKTYASDILITEVVREMKKWYAGNDFVKIPAKYPYERPSYIKIDGNRKITLTESDSYREVIGVYEDLKPLY